MAATQEVKLAPVEELPEVCTKCAPPSPPDWWKEDASDNQGTQLCSLETTSPVPVKDE